MMSRLKQFLCRHRYDVFLEINGQGSVLKDYAVACSKCGHIKGELPPAQNKDQSDK